MVGKGGYGTVYKAVLKDGTYVAVKRLDQVGLGWPTVRYSLTSGLPVMSSS